mmetsp:Transcript_23493/g.35672  ORF Transcript_23493/g.35672 Transcript_23493/m.35672 type:complete len:243 (-) Transcript_23493:3314-4042(-)
MRELQNAVQGSHQVLQTRASTSEKVLDGLSDSINVVKALLGRYNEDPDLPPTIWGVLKVLQAKLDKIEKATSTLLTARTDATAGEGKIGMQSKTTSNDFTNRRLGRIEANIKKIAQDAASAALDAEESMKLSKVANTLTSQTSKLVTDNVAKVKAFELSIHPLTDPNGILRQSIIKAGVFVSQQLPALLQDIAAIKQTMTNTPMPTSIPFANAGNLSNVATAPVTATTTLAKDPVIVLINQN